MTILWMMPALSATASSDRLLYRPVPIPYLAGDEVLTYRQCHLDGVGPVGDGGGVELDLPGAMSLVGLAHRLPKYLLMFFGAQNRPDIHNLGVAPGSGKREQEQNCQKEEAHPVHGFCPPRLSQRPVFGGLPSSKQGEAETPQSGRNLGFLQDGGVGCGWRKGSQCRSGVLVTRRRGDHA